MVYLYIEPRLIVLFIFSISGNILYFLSFFSLEFEYMYSVVSLIDLLVKYERVNFEY